MKFDLAISQQEQPVLFPATVDESRFQENPFSFNDKQDSLQEKD